MQGNQLFNSETVGSVFRHVMILVLSLAAAYFLPFIVGQAILLFAALDPATAAFARRLGSGGFGVVGAWTGLSCLTLAKASRVKGSRKQPLLTLAYFVVIVGTLFFPTLMLALLCLMVGFRNSVSSIGHVDWLHVVNCGLFLLPFTLACGATSLVICVALERFLNRPINS